MGKKASYIENVIASAEFKKAITEAVKSGVYEDWAYDGECEHSFDNFDENIAANSVIEELKKYFLLHKRLSLFERIKTNLIKRK